MIAKVGLGIIGLSAISVGGVALNSPWLLGMDDTMPKYTTISSVENYSNTYAADKFGNKNAKYLISNEKNNTDWWKWAYRRLSKNEISEGRFTNNGNQKKVTTGYDGATDTALNKVCDEAYKEAESELKNDDDKDHTKFKKSEVWKYCSIGGIQPQTIEEFNTKNNSSQETYSTSDAIGSDSGQKSKLLSINSTNNDWIWDLKDKEFGAATLEDGFFKIRKEEANRKSIKDICKEAYGKKENSQGTGAEKITKTDTTKYCSLEGK